jgi:hypothetical protein
VTSLLEECAENMKKVLPKSTDEDKIFGTSILSPWLFTIHGIVRRSGLQVVSLDCTLIE